VLASAVAVAAVTGVVDLLHYAVPVLSLGAVYVVAVLPVAVFFGRAYAVAVSVASVLVFNYLFLPPVLTFTLAGEENWLTLAVYVATGLLVADLAARVRRRGREAEQRQREAALLAEAAAVLLSGASVEKELDRVAEGAAGVLGVVQVRIELGPEETPSPAEHGAPLRHGTRRVGTLYVTGTPSPSLEDRGRFLGALASLLAVAIDRETLAREVLEAEALRRSDSIKTAILQAVSHDLRSPLTAIRAAVEALDSPELVLAPADRERLLATALDGIGRMDRSIRNLLDLSRLQAGAARSERELRTVEGLVDQALHEVPFDRRVSVTCGLDVPLVSVDPTQLEHAFANLIDNALKFSPADAPVTVDVREAAGEVVVRIADRGPGLPARELESVFEPFRHGSGAGRSRGAGLGLPIAKGFVEANGGRISAESAPGEGAVFVVWLPAAATASAPSQPTAEASV
jgi:two-component system sensor histidine kinase KdpD